MSRPLVVLALLLLVAALAWRFVGGTAEPSSAGAEGAALAPVAEGGRVVLLRVVDSETVAPLAGARAVVRTGWGGDAVLVAETDARGEARLAGLPRHPDLSLEVTRRGALRRERPVRGDEERIVVALERGVPLDGLVRDAADGRPVAGASVSVRTVGDAPGRIEGVVTGEDGRFAVDGVPIGRACVVEVAADGFLPARVDERRWGGEGELVVSLARGATIEGLVRDEAGRAVRGADVFLRGAARTRRQDRVAGARTDRSGRFSIAGVAPGFEGAVLASKEGVGVARGAAFRVGPTETSIAHPELVLRPVLSRVVVRVFGADGAPVTDARIELSDRRRRAPLSPFTGEPMWDLRCDVKDGAFVTAPLAPGAYVLTVHAGPRFPEVRDVVVLEGRATEVDVRVADGWALEGRVVGPDGAPVVGEPVEFCLSEDAAPGPEEFDGVEEIEDVEALRAVPRARTETGEDGTFRFEGLPDRPGRLRIGEFEGFGERGFDAAWSSLEVSSVRPGGPPLERTLRPAATVAGRIAPPSIDVGLEARVEVGPLARTADVTLGEGGRFELRFARVARAIDLMLVPRSGAPWCFPDLVLAPGERRDLGTLRATDGVRVEGRVVDSSGRPIDGAHARASPERWSWGRDARADDDGRFALDGLPAGTPGIVRIEHPAYRTEVVALADFAAFDVRTIVLRRPGRVAGRVRSGAEGDGALWVVAASARAGEPAAEARVAADGRFDVSLWPGPHRLRVVATDGEAPADGEGTVRAERDVTVVEGEETTLEIDLRDG